MEEDPESATARPILVPRLLLGLNTNIRGNVQCITDDEIIYPVGTVLVIHNIIEKRQKYIKLHDRGSNVNLIVCSPNKRLLAVCDTGDKPSVTIYDPWTCKKRKQIFMPTDRELTATRIEALAFTFDSKSLMLVLGSPDWQMLVYSIDMDVIKLKSMIRANNSNNTGTVVQICPNPSDPNLVVLIGKTLFRNIQCVDNVWKQFGFNKAEKANFTSACWINQERLVAGTSRGRILFFENGEVKQVYNAAEMGTVVFKDGDDPSHVSSGVISGSNVQIRSEMGSVMSVIDQVSEIQHLTPTAHGFFYGFQQGVLHYFERVAPHKYVRKLVARIPHNSNQYEEFVKDDMLEYANTNFNEIISVCVTPSEDQVLCTCNETQIYIAKLVGKERESIMTPFGLSLHHGPISALAVCSRKPIFMTTGVFDRSLRVWNYENETLDIMEQYEEDIYSCDLHPTGLFAAVGFASKLRILKLMMNDFATDRDLPIRSCKLVKFSKLGHLFAVVSGNVIQVYSTVGYEHMLNLKGHVGTITGLSWVHDDYKLSSCGTEGAVYEWQISTTRRICETIIKSTEFSGIGITNDGTSNFAVGSDGKIREIMNSNVSNELQICSGALDCMRISNSDNMFFASGNNGVIYTLLVPVTKKSLYNEYLIHSRRISSIQISYDDKHLFTVSPSCICIWEIMVGEQYRIQIDKTFAPLTEILIKRADLLNQLADADDLRSRLNELQTEHAYQMRQTETAHTALVQEIQEHCQQSVDDLKEKNDTLEQAHSQEMDGVHAEIGKMHSQHELFVQKLEASYNEKLFVEYDKLMLLEEKLRRTRMHYDKELQDLADARKVSEDAIVSMYDMQMTEKNHQLDELKDTINIMTREAEIMKSQIEEDADREIYELKTQFEKELRLEQNVNVRLRGETKSAKEKVLVSQKNIDDLMHSLNTHEIEQHRLKAVIVALEQTISDKEKEIMEQDHTIQEKEKHNVEQIQNNQELQKAKFILEFKIGELNSQIEPRNRTIQEKTAQISEMVTELENLQKIIQGLELQLGEVRSKLRTSDSETKREVVRNRAAKVYVKRIKTEIHSAAGVAHNVPKLKAAVRKMYHKYNEDKDFTVTHAEDMQAKNEFLRQRDFLEKSVRSLRAQVAKSNLYTDENVRMVDHNAKLIAETNNLRRFLKVVVKDNKAMRALLGCRVKPGAPIKPRMLLKEALGTKEEIRKEYIEIIEEGQRAIAVLQEENERLKRNISQSNRVAKLNELKGQTELQ